MSGEATVAPGPARLRLPRALRRWLRLVTGRRKRSPGSQPRSADDHAIAWLWPHLALTAGRRYPPLYENRDAFILQMGRVGSVSIAAAVRRRGYNAYHSHGFSDLHCAGTLQRLQDRARLVSDSIAMRSHLAAVAHGELLHWYKRHKRRNGQRLKIITLTRDPATWMSSHLVLVKYATLPRVRRWYAAVSGLDPAQGADDAAMMRAFGDAAAMRAFGTALGRLILEVRPSRGLGEALAELHRVAAARWPAAPDFIGAARDGFSCAEWFDRQMKPVIGLDLLADATFRETGLARVETDYADVMLVRFENLNSSAGVLGDFLGARDFVLPHVNATARTDDRAALRAAFEAGIEDAGGPAVRRELRMTEYGRACGYDRLTD
jgi:Putative capsular polysaccharide synthesis protein